MRVDTINLHGLILLMSLHIDASFAGEINFIIPTTIAGSLQL